MDLEGKEKVCQVKKLHVQGLIRDSLWLISLQDEGSWWETEMKSRSGLGFGNIFLVMIPKTQMTKEKLD